MISHHYKCIFIHIPKTAGQSIEHVFLNLHGLTWETRAPLLLRVNDQPEIGPPALAHLKAEEYVKHQYISQELFGQYFKFTFVRNPWSRVVSFYKYLGYHHLFSFDTFVFTILPLLLKEYYYFFRPQTDFIYHGQTLLVDYVGRFENLQNDFVEICKRIGIDEQKIPYINKSTKRFNINDPIKLLRLHPTLLFKLNLRKKEYKDFRAYYTERTKQQVKELYQDDVEYLNYEF